jgi:molecular chaperone GrpE (heat shock protein)
MSDSTELKFAKWPFYAACILGDVILLGCAYFIYTRHSGAASGAWDAFLVVFCGTIGALLAVTPFFLEYQTAVKMVETGALVSTVAQIQHLEEIAIRIGIATSQWQGVQEHSSRTTAAAKEIAERMTIETAAFTEFLQKSNDGERANLRLEVEKLRRAEGEWLQVLVRMLDHIYALNQAAARSGQPGLIEQLGQFQNACRDVARRIGLTPLVPTANQPFDAKCHTTPDGNAAPAAGAKIGEVLATGYTFQGQLIRPALVSLQELTTAPVALDTLEPAVDSETSAKAEQKEVEVEEQSLL